MIMSDVVQKLSMMVDPARISVDAGLLDELSGTRSVKVGCTRGTRHNRARL